MEGIHDALEKFRWMVLDVISYPNYIPGMIYLTPTIE